VPINDVVTVMGHEQATTTLNLYTHRSPDRDSRVRRALAEFLLTSAAEADPLDDEDP
jgi:hypothetical protein